MKTLFRTMVFALMAIGMLLTACTDDEATTQYQGGLDNHEILSGIPNDFDFSTTKQTKLSVFVDDKYDQQYYYTVEVFATNPLTDTIATLLSGGKTKGLLPFSTKLVIPNVVTTLYIRCTDPFNVKNIYSFEVKEDEMVCRLGESVEEQGAQNAARSIQQTTEVPTIPTVDFTVPADAITVTEDLKTEDMKEGHSYIITSDGSYNLNLNSCARGVKLYVKAKWKAPSTCLLGSQVFVLNGGSITSSNVIIMDIEELLALNIQQGGLVKAEGSISIAKKIINNAGEIETKELNCENAVSIYNKGKITLSGNYLSGGGAFNFMSSSVLVNEGDVYAPITNIPSDGIIYNKEKAGYSTEKLIMNSNEGLISNDGHFFVGDANVTNATIETSCKFEMTKLETNGAIFRVSSLGIMKCEYAKIGGGYIYMDDLSMWVGKQLDFSNQLATVVGGTDDYALIKVESLSYIGGSKVAKYLKKVEIEAQTIQDPSNRWNPRVEMASSSKYAEGAASTVIPPCDCNDNIGNNYQGEGEGDTDPEYVDTETLAYTYLFEDTWPSFSDYDMNDLVMDVQILNKKLEDKTVGFKYKVKVRAAGATFPIGSGFQLEGIPASNVTAENLENGQTYAVIRLFENVHTLFGSEEQAQINTWKKEKEAVLLEGTVTFNTPIDGEINASNFNLFITTNGMNKNPRKEVHLPYWNGTDFAATNATSINYLYKPLYDAAGNLKFGKAEHENMMWALRIPALTSISYPKETKSIILAYPKFEGWIKNGGKEEDLNNWYLEPVIDYVVSEE